MDKIMLKTISVIFLKKGSLSSYVIKVYLIGSISSTKHFIFSFHKYMETNRLFAKWVVLVRYLAWSQQNKAIVQGVVSKLYDVKDWFKSCQVLGSWLTKAPFDLNRMILLKISPIVRLIGTGHFGHQYPWKFKSTVILLMHVNFLIFH